MLRMDPFRVAHPTTVERAVSLLADHDGKARICAGGTDLIPNIKHGLHEPELVVHLGKTAGLRGIERTGDELVIGALTSLHDVTSSELVREAAPGLADAAGLVAGPQLRRMGTLGGNLCLDTRCLYYNQTHFWREALGYCLKKDGTVCHVVQSGKKCVAAASNDTATMLLCLDAVVEVEGPEGRRDIPLSDFYVADGVHNTVLGPADILVRARVPVGGARRREGYAKLRHRESIDYPMLSVGARFDLDASGVITAARLVVSALAARPKAVKTDMVIGKRLDDEAIAQLSARAHKSCHPQTNICDDPAWRKDMVPVYVARACRAARDRESAA